MAAEEPTGTRRPRFNLALPAFAFVGSGCLLVLELVAARLIAPDLGVSLYTWTSVIGVVLGGVSLGNYIGGRIADRWPSRGPLAIVYLAAAAASVLVLVLVPHVGSIELPRSAPALLQVLWVTAVLFLLPATILGAPTPILTRLSMHSVEESGRVVGRIQAAATLGSIVGTFLTGFALISWFGTRHIVAGVAFVLVVLAALARPPRSVVPAVVIVVLLAGTVTAGWMSPSPCTVESNYFCIKVTPGTLTFKSAAGQPIKYTPPIQSLHLDRLLHGVIDINNPTDLQYAYEHEYVNALDAYFTTGTDLSSFVIGGGGYAFPRYLEATYSGVVTVAEIDPEVTKVAEQHLGLTPSARLHIISKDARIVLEDLPKTTKYDAIFGDAFNDYEVPYLLTTREFDRIVSDHLTSHGVYLLNVVDGVHYDFLRSEIRTLQSVFPFVFLAKPDLGWPATKRDTFVLVASNSVPSPFAIVDPNSIDQFLAHGHSVLLTDDYAPVDELLAPVFSQELKTDK